MTDLGDGDTSPPTAAEEWIASQWDQALMRIKGFEGGGGLLGWKYTGKCDPKPLGKLMLAGIRMPEKIAHELGVMLAPRTHWRGPRIKVIPPAPKRTANFRSLYQTLDAYARSKS